MKEYGSVIVQLPDDEEFSIEDFARAANEFATELGGTLTGEYASVPPESAWPDLKAQVWTMRREVSEP